MKDLSFFQRIYVATKPVDFRKQAHGLAVIVQHSFNLVAPEKDLICYIN
jgi:hypothetical protein